MLTQYNESHFQKELEVQRQAIISWTFIHHFWSCTSNEPILENKSFWIIGNHSLHVNAKKVRSAAQKDPHSMAC